MASPPREELLYALFGRTVAKIASSHYLHMSFVFGCPAKMPSVGQRRPALPRADPAVPSALGGLTSGFGMGPGVPPLPWSLTNVGHSAVRAVPWGPHSATDEDVLHLGPQDVVMGHVEVRARPISTARLRRSHALHLPPINLVVYQGPYRRENSSWDWLPA